MYWARSQYHIQSLQDLELLATIFKGVKGELEITTNNDQSTTIQWTQNPFTKLLENKDQLVKIMPFNLITRLCGPDTIRVVSPQLNKLNPNEFTHQRKNILMIWADYIDSQIQTEMKRSNDLGYTWQNPKEEVNSMDEFLLACRLSKHATHVLFGTHNSALVFNQQCVYLPSLKFTQTSKIDACIFDKDDGFSPVFSQCDQQLEYINSKFKLWKNNEFKGKLSDYCHEYKHHLIN